MALYRIWLLRGVGTKKHRESPKAIHIPAPSVHDAEEDAKQQYPHRIIYKTERLDAEGIETHGMLV